MILSVIHHRHSSDAAQHSAETPAASDEAKSSDVDGARVSLRSSLNEAELAKFAAIAESSSVSGIARNSEVDDMCLLFLLDDIVEKE